ncbi:MAG: hypothetical protein AAGK78_16750, partial [Planctomycetota bacterium]
AFEENFRFAAEFEGNLTVDGDVDVYAFTIPAFEDGMFLEFQQEGDNADYELRFFDPAGNELADATYGILATPALVASETYYLGVSRFGQTTYDLNNPAPSSTPANIDAVSYTIDFTATPFARFPFPFTPFDVASNDGNVYFVNGEGFFEQSDELGPALALGFTADVDVDFTALEVVDVGTQSSVDIGAVDINVTFISLPPNGPGGDMDLFLHTLRLLDGPLPDGDYQLRLPQTAIVSQDQGTASPISLEADFFVLAGDANLDRRVDLQDFLVLRAHFGSGTLFTEGNFNYDGRVDLADFLVLRGTFNVSLDSDDGDDESLFSGGG